MTAKLALEGGQPAIRSPLRPYNSIGHEEEEEVTHLMWEAARGGWALSGYLAGQSKAGAAVTRLEEHATRIFGSRHAIACNSATSGLLAACVAAQRLRVLDYVAVPALSMSATAAVPVFLGAGNLEWADADSAGNARPGGGPYGSHVDTALVTDMFGYPADFAAWRKAYPDALLIEDAAQSIMATRNGKFAGTLGDIGVLSFNVHKQLNAGEGGLILTDSDDYAAAMRAFINHGEATGGRDPGLNLRMTELTAVIALSQLRKAPGLIENRRTLHTLFDAWSHRGGASSLLPSSASNETSAYCFAFTVPAEARDHYGAALRAEGLPCLLGYPPGPLYRLPAFHNSMLFSWWEACVVKTRDRSVALCPNAERLHDTMIVVELCRFDPTAEQMEQIGEAFEKAARVLR